MTGVGLCHLRLDRLGDGADLVDLEQEAVARLLLDGGLDAEGVGHGQVIADDLDARVRGEVAPRLPVVLVEGVLDHDDRVLLRVALVELCELRAREPLGRVRVGVLEVEVVLAVLVELGRGNVERDLDLALVAGLLDRLGE